LFAIADLAFVHGLIAGMIPPLTEFEIAVPKSN
jgi:hypothetical protein